MCDHTRTLSYSAPPPATSLLWGLGITSQLLRVRYRLHISFVTEQRNTTNLSFVLRELHVDISVLNTLDISRAGGGQLPAMKD
jgi:hypothetical protein